MPNRGKDTFYGVRGPHVIPMLGREAVEGQQGIAVLGQALDGPRVLGAVLLLEGIKSTLRCLEVGRHPDLPQVLLDRGLDGFRHLVDNVASFVHHPNAIGTVRFTLAVPFLNTLRTRGARRSDAKIL
ncbi:hypothetical protein GGE65_007429 [Skermanella aerolata]